MRIEGSRCLRELPPPQRTWLAEGRSVIRRSPAATCFASSAHARGTRAALRRWVRDKRRAYRCNACACDSGGHRCPSKQLKYLMPSFQARQADIGGADRLPETLDQRRVPGVTRRCCILRRSSHRTAEFRVKRRGLLAVLEQYFTEAMRQMSPAPGCARARVVGYGFIASGSCMSGN